MNIYFRFFTSIILFFLVHQQTFCAQPFQRIQNGVQIHTSGTMIQVQFYTPKIVRVQKWNDTSRPDSASLIIIQKPIESLAMNIQDEDSVLTLSSTDLYITIRKNEGSIIFETPSKNPFLRERGPAVIQSVTLKNETAFSITQNFQLTVNEGIYGLGQHQYGYMNYRGHTGETCPNEYRCRDTIFNLHHELRNSLG